MANLFESLSSSAKGSGERLAIAGNNRTTYRQLLNRALQVGRELQAAGGPENQPVGILADHGTPMLAALLGTWSVGRIAVPLDKRWTPSIIEERLVHADVATVISDDPDVVKRRPNHHCDRRIIDLDLLDLRDACNDFDDSALKEGDCQRPALVFCTSGTTGHPKGVLHSHQAMLHNIASHTRLLRITSSDRGLLLANLSTISGLTDSMRILLCGGTLFPYELASGGLSGLIDQLGDSRPTIVHFVPTVFRRLSAMLDGLGDAQSTELLSSIRVLHLGGETVTRGDFERFRRFFSKEAVLLHNLGCTEVPSFRHSVRGAEWMPTSEMLPLDRDAEGKKVELIDTESGARIVAVGEPGEIVVSSRKTALGYWRDGSAASRAFRNVCTGEVRYSTGDMGQWLQNGSLMHLGRRDDQVKLLGRAVSLGEIESALMNHPDVAEAAVVAIQESLSTRLVAFCSGSQTLQQTNLQRWAADLLEEWQVPQCRVLTQLPTLTNGKVDRVQLRSLVSSSFEREDNPGDVPRTEMETRLARIWMRVLGTREICRNDTLTDLGADSLHMVELLREVEREFGQRLRFGDLLQYATLECMATQLSRSEKTYRMSRYLDVLRTGSSPVIVIGYGETARSVVKGIPEEHGVLFLKIPGLHDRPIRYRSIATSLECYAVELQKFTKEVPAAIVGFSYGGLLAYALASQLWEAGARPAVVALIEPATPRRCHRGMRPIEESAQNNPANAGRTLKSSQSTPRHRIWEKATRRSNWLYIFRYCYMLIKNELGHLHGQQCWELFRPAIRWNSRRFVAPAYEGDMLLVGSSSFLNAQLPRWKRIVSGRVRPLALVGDQRHDAYLDSENECRWLQAIRSEIAVAEATITESSSVQIDAMNHQDSA